MAHRVKSVYCRKGDLEVWEEMKRLRKKYKISLSQLVTQALRDYIAKQSEIEEIK